MLLILKEAEPAVTILRIVHVYLLGFIILVLDVNPSLYCNLPRYTVHTYICFGFNLAHAFRDLHDMLHAY
jgi:hypothetical protein